RTPVYMPTAMGRASSSRCSGAAGTVPETDPIDVHPAEPCRLTDVAAIDSGVRVAPTTTSVPVEGCKRGSASKIPATRSATRAPPTHRTRGLGRVYGPTRGRPPYFDATRSMYAGHNSATAWLSIWTTFSAFCSPLGEGLKLPAKPKS